MSVNKLSLPPVYEPDVALGAETYPQNGFCSERAADFPSDFVMG